MSKNKITSLSKEDARKWLNGQSVEGIPPGPGQTKLDLDDVALQVLTKGKSINIQGNFLVADNEGASVIQIDEDRFFLSGHVIKNLGTSDVTLRLKLKTPHPTVAFGFLDPDTGSKSVFQLCDDKDAVLAEVKASANSGERLYLLSTGGEAAAVVKLRIGPQCLVDDILLIPTI